MWAREGDRNTSYFHSSAKARKTNNTIHGLFNAEGAWCEEDQELESIIMGYFGELFQSSNSSLTMIEEVIGSVETRVTPEMNA